MAVFSAGSGDIKIFIEVDATGAVKSIKTTEDALKGVETQAKKTEGALKGTEGTVGGAFKQSFSGAASSIAGAVAKLSDFNKIALATAAGTFAGGVAVKAFSGALDLLGKSVTLTLSSLSEASRLEGIKQGFESIQNSAGNLSDVFLGKLRTATQGYLSDIDLMQQANQAVLLGLPTKGFDQMAASALKLGRAMGLDATRALESLTIGIGRQSRLVLDNLGVIVEAEQAYKNFAAANNIVGRELTDNEQRLAFQREAYEQISRKAATLAGIQDTAAASFVKVGSAVSNLKKEFILGISSSETLAKAFQELAQSIDGVDVEGFGRALGGLVGIVVNLTNELVELAGGIQQTGKAAIGIFDIRSDAVKNFQALTGAGEAYKKKLEEVEKKLKLVRSPADFQAIQGELLTLEKQFQALYSKDKVFAVDQFSEANDRVIKKIAALQKQFASGKLIPPEELAKINQEMAQLGLTVQDLLKIDRIKNARQELEGIFAAVSEGKIVPVDAEKQINAIIKKYGITLQNVKDLGKYAAEAEAKIAEAVRKGAQAREKADREEKQRRKQEQRELERQIIEENKLYGERVKKAAEAARESDKYAETLKKLERGSISAGQAHGEMAQHFKDVLEAQNEVELATNALEIAFLRAAQAGQTLSDVDLTKLSARIQEATQRLESQTGKGGKDKKRSFIADYFDLGDSQDEFFGQIEGALAGALGDVAQGALSGRLRESIAEVGGSLGSSLGEAVGGPFGQVFGEIIGDKISNSLSQLGASTSKTGSAIETAINTIFPGVGSIFGNFFGGGDSEGTEARKQADAFFADLFDANRISVIINGKLQELQDLVFSGNQEGGGIFGGLPEATQQAFEGIGAAIEASLGIGADLGVNLGNVLANNIGGELNNLQVILAATGKSFEDLGNTVIQSFLEGKLAIIEAQLALEALRDVSLPGIPGEIGNVSKAWSNFQAAIANNRGSRALLDAMRDIGAEAQELGLSTFPSLANALVQSFGFSTQQVAAFFEAMKVAGINSIEQLVQASQAQLIAVAANVQQITQGGAATHQGVDLTTQGTSPSNFRPGGFASAGGGGGGGGGGGTDPAKQAAQDLRRSINQLVQSSEDYRVAVNSLNNGLITQADFQRLVSREMEQAGQLLRRQAQLEEALDKEQEKGRNASKKRIAALLADLGLVKQKIQDFGKFDITIDSVKEITDNLNDMGTVANALGLSFGQLSSDIVNAFKRGSISASEAKQQLEGIVPGKGIPEVVGGIENAVRNLQEAGTKGGIFSIDAFRDIFAEARERGIDSIGALQEFIRKNNILSVEQGGTLFQVFYEQGLKTFQDIENLNDEAVIGILARLQDLKFPFEESSDRIATMLANVQALTAAKHNVKVDLEVNTRIDRAGRTVMELLMEDDSVISTRQGPGVDAKNKKNNKGRNKDKRLHV